ncbi:MAG: type II secretion system F family protein [Oligoflexia bacterium]|nr:type II secretion system F family protein [Oligoflexia bacterium]
MSWSVLLMLAIGAWLGVVVASQARGARRELGRFRTDGGPVMGDANRFFERIVASLGNRFGKKQDYSLGAQAMQGAKDPTRGLVDAGLESTAEQGKFFLMRTIAYLVGPALGGLSYIFIRPYYATIITLVCSAAGILIPMFWLKGRIAGRVEEIQRELPLVLDLTNLGTSAGWDVSSSLERVIDSLYSEFPKHPLIRELKKARWLAASGYTWEEALRRAGNRLNNETVKRTTLALGQAIRQGGDRSKQLEGIAEDAQRVYYGELDRRLAALPVKALLATMMLMVAYFVILMAPAVVQIKNTTSQTIKHRAEAAKGQRGSVTLIEVVLIMTFALVIFGTIGVLGSSIGNSTLTDSCVVQADYYDVDFANPSFDPATACPTPATAGDPDGIGAVEPSVP